MVIPQPTSGALYWGVDQLKQTNGSAQWCPVRYRPPGNEHGAATRWFPLEHYSAETIMGLCGEGTFRVTFTGRQKRTIRPPSQPFELRAVPAPTETGAPAEQSSPTVPSSAPSSLAVATPPMLAMPPGQAPPRPLFRGELAPEPLAGPLERCHYMAIQDTDRVVQAICTMSATQTQAVTAMASAMIATAAGDRDQWKGLAMQALQALSAPRPEIALLGQKLEQQSAALAQVAGAVGAVKEQLDEEDDEPPPPPPDPTQSVGAQIAKELVPLAAQAVPRIIDAFTTRMNRPVAGAAPLRDVKVSG